jgi:hypothetical protein
VNSRPIRDVVEDAFWKWIALLKYHANPLTELDEVDAVRVDVLLVNRNRPGKADPVDQVVHPVDASKKSRFSASGWSNEGSNLSGWDGEINSMERFEVTVEEFNIFDVNFYLLSCHIHARISMY